MTITPPTLLSPERLAEIREFLRRGISPRPLQGPTRPVLYDLADELLAHINAQASELRTVDAVLARRPALDDFATRTDKIAHAIATAKTADALDAEILALRAMAWRVMPDEHGEGGERWSEAFANADQGRIAAEDERDDLRRQLDAETAAHRDVQQASLSWQEIAREYKTKLDAKRRHIVLVHGEVKEVLGRLLDDPPAPARDAPLVAPPGTKNHDLAPPCPKCGSDRYWSDYWTDELTPICVPCRRPVPPALPSDAPGETKAEAALIHEDGCTGAPCACHSSPPLPPSEAPAGLVVIVERFFNALSTDPFEARTQLRTLLETRDAHHATLREQERGDMLRVVESTSYEKQKQIIELRDQITTLQYWHRGERERADAALARLAAAERAAELSRIESTVNLKVRLAADAVVEAAWKEACMGCGLSPRYRAQASVGFTVCDRCQQRREALAALDTHRAQEGGEHAK